ncbi:MAG TPA: DUF4136 domain-containing protein [Burkholderiaceae bacterium]|nr:DUF4136 domain-containing protein [Burkholderiaceae bacterium]
MRQGMLWMRAALSMVLAGLLAGCAGLNTVTSEVATYGDWPAGRTAGRYAFERLPSQQAQPQRQAELEAAAASALEKAGFSAAGDASQADVIVQIGARIARTEVAPWDDPLWWRWGAGYWHSPGWYRGRAYIGPPYWALRADWGTSTRYERSVALLLRERATGAPLYEAHARSEGFTPGDRALVGALFEAALKDFPATAATNPRQVTVTLAP